MANLGHLEEVAINLVKGMTFDWSDYCAESRLYEKRVPKIRFQGDGVRLMVDEVNLFRLEKYKRYLREVQVEFKDCTLIFELSAIYYKGDTDAKFTIGVYTPAGDGVGGVLTVMPEHDL